MSLLIWYSLIPHYFHFPSLSLHCWSTAMHPTATTSCASLCAHSCTTFTFVGPFTSCSIGPASLIWWTCDLWTSLFTFPFLVTWCTPAVAQLITSCHVTWSGTYCSFTSDEPCACFLDYHSYLTCLYIPFNPYTSFPQSSGLRSSSSLITLLCPLLPNV